MCTVCEDEVPSEHFVKSHFLTPLTLCYECFSWRDILVGEYFFSHVDRRQKLWRRLVRRRP